MNLFEKYFCKSIKTETIFVVKKTNLNVVIMTIQLFKALSEGDDTIVVATGADLKEFAQTLLSSRSTPSSNIEIEKQMDDERGKRYLSSVEVCKLLGISKTTLWRYQQAGLLYPARFGQGKRSRLRFEKSEVMRLLAKTDRDSKCELANI